MRDANKPLQSDLFKSDRMDFYQDMHDQQLSLFLSGKKLGLAEIIKQQLSKDKKMPDQTGELNGPTSASSSLFRKAEKSIHHIIYSKIIYNIILKENNLHRKIYMANKIKQKILENLIQKWISLKNYVWQEAKSAAKH